MIISKEVEVKICSTVIKHYRDLGYENIYKNSIINVKVEDLSKSSAYKIDVECDSCQNIINIKYCDYMKIISKKTLNGKYYCYKCKNTRTRETCLVKYGVDNPSKNKENREKAKNTMIEKYGHYYNNREKSRETCLERYGVDHISKLDETKQKKKETCLNKYGVESYMQTDKFKKSYENLTGYKKPLNNPISFNKMKLTNIKKYGVEFHMQNKEICYKACISNWIRNGSIYYGNNSRDQLKLYTKIVRRITNRSKIKMIENWDGYDYYDNEYIRDYSNEYHLSPNFPTIDHKISIRFGFNNNILPSIIGDESNLCFTKRKINEKKGQLNELDYKKSEL